jgi:hypothetical protein
VDKRHWTRSNEPTWVGNRHGFNPEEAARGRLHHYDTRTQLVLILDGREPKPDRWIDTRQYTQRCLSEN